MVLVGTSTGGLILEKLATLVPDRLQRLVFLDVPAITSASRYRQEGYARRVARNLLCLSLWALGVSPQRIAKIYS